MSAKTIGRSILILLLMYFTWTLLTQNQPWIPLDAANLLFHEGGHLIFLPFGQFSHMLGGSLIQILLPCIFLVYFIFFRKDYFASSVMLFWLGDNFINVSIYISDAQTMQLPLLIGGSIHDWNWILTQLGILTSAKLIGGTVFFTGALCIVVSIILMSWLTFIDAFPPDKIS
jgi:hypothetical protein